MTRTRMVGISAAVIFLIAVGLWLFRPSGHKTLGEHKGSGETETALPVPKEAAGGAKAKATGNPLEGEANLPEEVSPATVFGRVLMADNHRPVAGAKVVLIRKNRDGERERLDTVTDRSGDFSLTGPLSGRYSVYAEKDALVSFRKWRAIHKEDIDRDRSPVGPITLYLHPTHQLTLKIVSGETGEPVQEATLELLFDPGSVYRAGEKGQIELRLSPEIWNIEVKAPGFLIARKALDLLAQKRRVFLLALQPAGVCTGKVVDQAGLPLEGVRVDLSNRNYRQRAVTGTDGRFRLDHLPLEKPLRVFAYKEEYQPYHFDGLVVPAESRTIGHDFVLSPDEKDEPKDFTLTGMVVDTEHQPIARARIFPMRGGSEAVETFSTTDGSFRLVLPWRHRHTGFGIEAEGYATAQLRHSWRNESESSVRIVLERAHSLRGKVVDAWGNPVAGARIQVTGSQRYRSPRQEPETTDTDGKFSLEGLPSKTSLSVWAEDFSPKWVPDIPADRDDLEIVLSGLGVLVGKVVDKKTGRPVPEFNMAVRNEASNYRGGSSAIDRVWSTDGIDFQSPDGSFLIDGLTVDTPLKLILSNEAFAPQSFDSLLPKPEPEAEELLLTLERQSVPVAGVVVDRRGNPRPGVTVNLLGMDPEGHFMPSFQTLEWSKGSLDEIVLLHQTSLSNADGEFRFERAPKNLALHLCVDQEGLARTALENLQHFPDDQRENLVLTVPEAGRLNLVLNRKRFPDPGWVFVYATDGLHFNDNASLAPEQDLVTMDRLSAGTYQVQWHAQQMKNGVKQVVSEKSANVEEGQNVEVRLGFDDLFRIAGIAYSHQNPLPGQGLALQKAGEGTAHGSLWQTLTTDEHGAFEFKDIEKGAYDLVLVSGDFRNFRFMNQEERNRIHLGTVDRDIFDHFQFEKLGGVHGRLVVDEMTALLFLQGLQTDQGFYRGHTVPDAQALFRFDDVPAGVYALSWVGESHSGSKLLVDQILVPDDGSDVDLGDVRLEEEGSLRILLHGDLGEAQTRYVYVQVFPFQTNPELPEHGQALAGYNEQDDDGILFLEKVPAGPVKVFVRLNDQALASDPTMAVVDIVPGETTDLQIRVEAVTMLTIQAVQGNYFTSVRLTHSQTGAMVDLQERDTAGFFNEDMPLDLAYFSTGIGFARNLPEGEWSLRATDDQGRDVARVVNLVRGKAVHLTLKFD